MFLVPNKRLFISSAFFVLSMLLIGTTRPSFLFNNDGTIKEFGLEDNQSIYSLGVLVVTLCILIFYIFSMIDLMYN
jgi:hypothetical protein